VIEPQSSKAAVVGLLKAAIVGMLAKAAIVALSVKGEIVALLTVPSMCLCRDCGNCDDDVKARAWSTEERGPENCGIWSDQDLSEGKGKRESEQKGT
jgi:hypothetical protein